MSKVTSLSLHAILLAGVQLLTMSAHILGQVTAMQSLCAEQGTHEALCMMLNIKQEECCFVSHLRGTCMQETAMYQQSTLT